MNQENRSLSEIQVVVTLISMMIGVRFLTFPREVTEAVQTPDGWISSLLTIGMALLAGATVGLLARMFPDKSYFEYVPEIIGRVPGYVVASGYISYLTLFVAYEMRVLGEVVRYYLLPQTPIPLILFLLMMAVVYLILGGIRPLVRIQQLFLPIVLSTLIIMFILLLPVINLTYFQPVMTRGITPILKGIPQNAFATLGFALIVIFAPYMKRAQKAVKATVTAIFIVNVINLAAIFFALAVFGDKELRNIIFPVLEMIKAIEVPGGFVERLESIFLTIFIMTVFSTISIGLFACSHGLQSLYKTKRTTSVILLAAVSMLIALLPEELSQAFKLGDFIESVGVFYVGFVPAVLLQIVKARNLGIKNESGDEPKGIEEEVVA